MPNNPPAFPACNEANNNDTMGMTLRDAAVIAVLPWAAENVFKAGIAWTEHDVAYAKIATMAHDIAQAMLTERARRGGDDD